MSRTMSRFALPLVAALLLASSLASCGDDLLNLDQQWTLQTVRDSALPYTLHGGGHDVVITSGVANLHSDNTYSLTLTGTTDGAAGTVGADQGEWTINSSTFIFTSSTFTPIDYVAALTGTSFRATIPGIIVGLNDSSYDMVFSKSP
jgi:hypothetical protein